MARQVKMSRRSFLASSTRTAAALGAGAMLGARSAAAAKQVKGANDRIVLGLIGAGERGSHGVNNCLFGKNVVCAALCDVADFRLDSAERMLTKTMTARGQEGVKIERYDDFRKLLDRKDLDAVLIATPDVWHKAPFIAAVEAGKHVYQEKPFCYSIEHGLAMDAAARKRPELTIQIGTQRRSKSHYAKVKAFIDEGNIGDVRFVRAFDCRNWSGDDPFSPDATAKRHLGGQVDWSKLKIDWDRFQEPCAHKVPFDPWRYCAWRWFWDYAGGLVTDVGVHVIDNVHWLLGEPTPKSAACHGGVYMLKYWETPDVVNAVWDYGNFSLAFTSNFSNGFERDGFIVYGTKATIETRDNDVKVWAEGQRDQPIAEFKPEGVDHHRNWIDCIRSGERTNAPAELGFSSLLPSLMANMAYRKGGKVTWDPAKKQAV